MRKTLRAGQFSLLLIMNQAGELLSRLLMIPLPGSVAGMILLFILLSFRIIRLEWIEETTSFLLKHLSFFFIPISAGLMTLGPFFLKFGGKILFILLLSALAGMAVTGAVAQVLSKRQEANKNAHHHHSL